MKELTSNAAAVVGLVLSIIALGGYVLMAIQKIREPNNTQNKRLDALEKKVDRHSELFLNDLNRFEKMDAGNKIMQKCMLALLSHSIDGNDVDGMRTARKELNEYLINH